MFEAMESAENYEDYEENYDNNYTSGSEELEAFASEEE